MTFGSTEEFYIFLKNKLFTHKRALKILRTLKKDAMILKHDCLVNVTNEDAIIYVESQIKSLENEIEKLKFL